MVADDAVDSASLAAAWSAEGAAASAGSAPGALESLDVMASEDELSVADGVPGGVNPVEWAILGPGSAIGGYSARSGVSWSEATVLPPLLSATMLKVFEPMSRT